MNIECICGNFNYERIEKEYYEVSQTGELIQSLNGKVEFGKCLNCGIIRQAKTSFFVDEESYFEFYKNKYSPIDEAYKVKTYDSDRQLAKIRCEKYGIKKINDILFAEKILDVGSGSGAFVDECRELGHESYGCEISKYNYAKDFSFIYNAQFENINFPTDYFNKITLHDILEHSLTPIKIVNEMFRVLKQGGMCIVDFPHYFAEEGKRHWKTEHVWYFTVENLKIIFERVGFQISKIDLPIPAKVVFYLSKPKQIRIKILYPPGIGDSYWSIVKTQAFLKREKIGIPDIYIVCPREKEFDAHRRAFPFIEMFPFLCASYETVESNNFEDRKIWDEAYKNEGRTIFKNVLGYDYFISYNGNLRHGKRMDEVDFDLECNWKPSMFVSLEQEKFKEESIRKYGRYIVFYFVFQGTYINWTNEFSVENVIKGINEIVKGTNCIPVFAGAIWDEKKDRSLREVMSKVSGCVDLTGKTSIAQLLGLIKGSQGVVGYPSGLTIVSAMLGVKTLIIWNDYYNKDFAWNCCAPDLKNKTYFVENTKNLDFLKLGSRVKEEFKC